MTFVYFSGLRDVLSSREKMNFFLIPLILALNLSDSNLAMHFQ